MAAMYSAGLYIPYVIQAADAVEELGREMLDELDTRSPLKVFAPLPND
jgi:hypothetical protein